MAIVENTAPGAVLTGHFALDSNPQDPEAMAFVQKVEGMLRSGQLSAFVATRREEGGQVVIEVFPADLAPPGAAPLAISDAWAGATQSPPLADGNEAFAWGDEATT